MHADSGGKPHAGLVVVPVPEIRDYLQVNRRLTQLLDAGVSRIRLAGVEKQRLLVSGLEGPWKATIEIEGSAGPELAAGLNAPDLTVIAEGSAADGLGAGMKAGTLVLTGDTSVAAGYAQIGGTIVVLGSVAERVGLEQVGGHLIVFGRTGPLVGERQRGGTLVLLGPVDLHGLRHASRGGSVQSPTGLVPGSASISPETLDFLRRLGQAGLLVENIDLFRDGKKVS